MVLCITSTAHASAGSRDQYQLANGIKCRVAAVMPIAAAAVGSSGSGMLSIWPARQTSALLQSHNHSCSTWVPHRTQDPWTCSGRHLALTKLSAQTPVQGCSAVHQVAVPSATAAAGICARPRRMLSGLSWRCGFVSTSVWLTDTVAGSRPSAA